MGGRHHADTAPAPGREDPTDPHAAPRSNVVGYSGGHVCCPGLVAAFWHSTRGEAVTFSGAGIVDATVGRRRWSRRRRGWLPC